MASAEEADIHEHIQKEFGVDTRSLEFRTVKDQDANDQQSSSSPLSVQNHQHEKQFFQ